MDFIKNTIKKFFQNYLIKQVTAENLKQLFTDLIQFLRTKAEETDTIIDDWVIDALESIIKDEFKIEKIVEFIKKFLAPETSTDGGVILKAVPTGNNYMYLVKSFYGEDADVPENCKSIPWTVIKNLVELLQIVIPYILDLLTQKSENTECTENI